DHAAAAPGADQRDAAAATPAVAAAAGRPAGGAEAAEALEPTSAASVPTSREAQHTTRSGPRASRSGHRPCSDACYGSVTGGGGGRSRGGGGLLGARDGGVRDQRDKAKQHETAHGRSSRESDGGERSGGPCKGKTIRDRGASEAAGR